MPRCGTEDANAAVEAAHTAFVRGPWATMNASTRGKLLRRLGELIARDAEKLAAIETSDNGKLYAEMSAQLRYIPEWFHYFGGLADKIEGGVPPIDKPDMFVYTKREPLGVVVCITPWNSPLMLLSWKLAPALAAGNTIVIKPSEFTSCSTLALMELIKEAGFPDGVVNTVTGFGAEVGPTLVEHPKVAKIAFTGGDATGAAIYAQAARGIKHVTLELGGKSPNIAATTPRSPAAPRRTWRSTSPPTPRGRRPTPASSSTAASASPASTTSSASSARPGSTRSRRSRRTLFSPWSPSISSACRGASDMTVTASRPFEGLP